MSVIEKTYWRYDVVDKKGNVIKAFSTRQLAWAWIRRQKK